MHDKVERAYWVPFSCYRIWPVPSTTRCNPYNLRPTPALKHVRLHVCIRKHMKTHIDLITSKSLKFSYRKGNAWCVAKNHNTRTVSSVKYIMPLTMKTFTTQLFLFLAIFFHCHKYANKSQLLNNLLTHTFRYQGNLSAF